jgi:type VI protein secretion system component Hcp
VRRIHWAALAAASGLWFVAASAVAASDYYLKIGGVEGESESKDHKGTIEIQSWSFGAGKASMQDLSVSSTKAPQDAASGQATGKRQHKPFTVASSRETSAAATAPEVGSISTVSVVSAPGSATAARLDRLCASGKHIKSASLTGQGRVVELQDVVVSSCSSTANGRVHELRGHVTLIK